MSTSYRVSFISLLYLLCTLLFPGTASAQQGLSLSVSPTLFEMSAAPLQTWRSAVDVINSNPFPLTVYADVVNFAPQGEGGTGKFLPVFEQETGGATLAEWITLNREPIEIPRESSVQIPFSVTVPEDASPGGHFAAILIGTQPPRGEDRVAIRTSQVVTALFFVRIAGDVIEDGQIRSFTTGRTYTDTPAMDFQVRFENQGNVHLRPQGDITIYNMWGEERGLIPINHETNFGNVLPGSVRNFRFSWQGEDTFTELGRYRAVVTLAYGTDTRVHVTREVYFWVIPVQRLVVTVGTVVAIIWFLSWAIRAYVRRVLLLSGIEATEVGYVPRHQRAPQVMDTGTVRVERYHQMSAPVRTGIADLRSRVAGASAFYGRICAVASFVLAYRLFFLSIMVVFASLYAIIWYLQEATVAQRAYEVQIDNVDQTVTLSSEDVIYNTLTAHDASESPAAMSSTTPVIEIVNVSGIPGLAAELRLTLEQQGYVVQNISTDLERTSRQTAIVFDPKWQTEVLTLSQYLPGSLPSPLVASTTDEVITVYVGSDFVSE